MSKTYQGRCCSCFPQNSSTSFRAATSNTHKHQFIYYIFHQIAAATYNTAESDLSESICSNHNPSILRLVSFFDRYEGNKCQLLWSDTGEAWDKKILIQRLAAFRHEHLAMHILTPIFSWMTQSSVPQLQTWSKDTIL